MWDLGFWVLHFGAYIGLQVEGLKISGHCRVDGSGGQSRDREGPLMWGPDDQVLEWPKGEGIPPTAKTISFEAPSNFDIGFHKMNLESWFWSSMVPRLFGVAKEPEPQQATSKELYSIAYAAHPIHRSLRHVRIIAFYNRENQYGT